MLRESVILGHKARQQRVPAKATAGQFAEIAVRYLIGCHSLVSLSDAAVSREI
jgi:hypothetical protein